MTLKEKIKQLPKPIFKQFEFVYFIIRQIYYLFAYPKRIQISTDTNYWSNDIKHKIKSRDKIIANLIEESSSIMDIGCGNGRFLYYLKNNKKDIESCGIEISESAIDYCKSLGLNVKQLNISTQELDFTRKYDYICLLGILEHIKNPERIINKVKNKYNKKLIIFIPNIGFIFNRIRFLFGKFPLTFEGGKLGEHIRHWTKSDIKWWLHKFDYNIQKMIYCQGIPILNKLFPSLFCQNFIIIINRDIH